MQYSDFTIDLTSNNLFWAIVGSIFGLIASEIWSANKAKRNKRKLRIEFEVIKPYDVKGIYLSIQIYNDSDRILPLLYADLKMDGFPRHHFFFENSSDLTELKPQQQQVLRTRLTDENFSLIKEWREYFECNTSDIRLKVELKNSPDPLIYSNTLAVMAVAQVQYYLQNDFDFKNSWRWLEKKERQVLIKAVENKFAFKPTWIIKRTHWDKIPQRRLKQKNSGCLMFWIFSILFVICMYILASLLIDLVKAATSS